MGTVADGLLNRASDITRLIDRLEKAGLAERLPNPADRRSVLVRATAEGQRVFAAVTPKLQDFHRRQWSNLSSSEVDALHGLLAKALWGDAS
jgi:DNA-binding MarR family transcriptional regulator